MEFWFEGFNGYEKYSYVYNATRSELEYAVAIVMLQLKNQLLTEENIEQQIIEVQEQEIIDETNFIEENIEEIKSILKENVNADF